MTAGRTTSSMPLVLRQTGDTCPFQRGVIGGVGLSIAMWAGIVAVVATLS